MIEETAASKLRRDPRLPDRVWIAENNELENLLFDRNIVGDEFGRRCRAATSSLLSHFQDDIGPDFSELVILSKGVCYQVLRSHEELWGRSIGVNFVATQRAKVTSDDALIDVSYIRVDAPSSHLLIADTVASGATIEAALTAYQQIHELESVILLSFAGTTIGAERLLRFCEARNIQLTIVYGLASFGLGTNGFDLSFLHPETRTNSRYIERASRQFDGKPVSAVGWDFGSQWIAVPKYRQLCWLEATKWDMIGHSALQQAKEPIDLSQVQAELSALEG